jgi:predicted dehydrogenase
MSEPLRWGIISTGGIARTFVNDLQFTDSGRAVAVGSRTREAADSFADRFGIASRYGSYEELVADPDVDAVYVGTPHPMHFENAKLALEHGKPVLVEKAFTMSAREAIDLIEIARAKELFLMEAMWTRCLPHVAAVNEFIAAGELGDIVSVEADHGQYFDYDPSSRWFNPALGGGALLDLGVYPVSFASMLLGTPSKMVSMIDYAPTGVDRQVSMIFGYENGAQAYLNTTADAKTPTTATISGTKARIEIDGDFYAPSAFSLISRDGDARRFEFETQGRGLHFEAAEVARCIQSGVLESPLMPLSETVSIMQTMESVLAAASFPGGDDGH